MHMKAAVMPRANLSQYMISRVFMVSAFAFYILNSDLKLPIYSFGDVIVSW
jgi:hypothetical protein